MVIAESDAQFRKTEKILKSDFLFISQDTNVPLDIDPFKKWRGWEPAAYGQLLLTNERLIFLFEERTATTGDIVKSVAKGAAKGAASGAIQGVLTVLTLGISDLIITLVGLRGGDGVRIRNGSINFSDFKDSNASFAVDLQNIKKYTHKSASFGSYLPFKRPFHKVYLTLTFDDEEGNEMNYCLYSNRIQDKKFLNHNKWLKVIKKYNKNL